MLKDIFPGKVALQQRVLPNYRVPFIDKLAGQCEGGLFVYAGQPQEGEQITQANNLEKAIFRQGRNLHVLAITSPYYICWQTKLLRWLEDHNPDVLILEANSRYLSSRFALHWMHKRGRPVIGWGLGSPIIKGKFAVYRERIRKNYLLQFDALVAYSHNGMMEYIATGFPDSKVYTAINAVTEPPQHMPPDRPNNFLGKPKVLFVGRLQKRKRLDLLFNACASLPADIQPEIWIVGDGTIRKELENLANRIYPNVQFFGALFGKELEELFIKADLFVLPGTGGLAVQQAMAYALPVIVSEGDGTQKDLVRPENGWLIQPDDQKALTDALKDALSDVEKLRKKGLESYRIVSDEVNIQKMVEVFIRVINDVTGGG